MTKVTVYPAEGSGAHIRSVSAMNEEIELLKLNPNLGGSGNPLLYAHTGVTYASPFTTTANTPQLVDTWTLNIPADSMYSILVTVEWQLSATNQDAIFRFDVNGATGIEINQEPKDSTNNVFFTTFAFDSLEEGSNTIEFYARKEASNSNVLTIKSNRYTAQKIDEMS